MTEVVHDGRRYRVDTKAWVFMPGGVSGCKKDTWRRVQPDTAIFQYLVAKAAGLNPELPK